MNMIIFLTDGNVGNEDTLLALLAKQLDQTRLFTFGIGSAPNEYLMHRMAEAGRGQSRFIRSHEDVGTVMADFFHTLSAPVLTDISLKWEQNDIEVYPKNCPDIFRGRPLQLIAKSDQSFHGSLTITGMLDGQQQSYTLDLTPQNDTHHDAINKLYGRMKIKDFMVQRIQANTDKERTRLKNAVIQTALKYQLISQFTSRVAVEEKVIVEEGELLTVHVPVNSPNGWRLHATATQDTLLLVLGCALCLSAALLRNGKIIIPRNAEK
jgi:Ca-activated chloride channel family protein